MSTEMQDQNSPVPLFSCSHTPTPPHGLYNLLIRLPRRRVILVGRLGEFRFPAGYYVYTGSAMGGLEARIRRHLRKEKPLRWHIDYLLRFAEVEEVYEYPMACSCRTEQGIGRSECRLNEAILQLYGARVIVTGFGSSDCRCAAHLVHFSFRQLQKSLVKRAGESICSWRQVC